MSSYQSGNLMQQRERLSDGAGIELMREEIFRR